MYCIFHNPNFHQMLDPLRYVMLKYLDYESLHYLSITCKIWETLTKRQIYFYRCYQFIPLKGIFFTRLPEVTHIRCVDTQNKLLWKTDVKSLVLKYINNYNFIYYLVNDNSSYKILSNQDYLFKKNEQVLYIRKRIMD